MVRMAFPRDGQDHHGKHHLRKGCQSYGIPNQLQHYRLLSRPPRRTRRDLEISRWCLDGNWNLRTRSRPHPPPLWPSSSRSLNTVPSCTSTSETEWPLSHPILLPSLENSSVPVWSPMPVPSCLSLNTRRRLFKSSVPRRLSSVLSRPSTTLLNTVSSSTLPSSVKLLKNSRER